MTVPNSYHCPWIKGKLPEEPGQYWVSLSADPHKKHLVTYTKDGWSPESAKVISQGHGVIRYMPIPET